MKKKKELIQTSLDDFAKPEAKWITIGNERYVTGDDFFKCYEWCESQGKHKDEFDRCVKECLGVRR
ncbi:hypothetical protein [Sulfolobus spindle-shaped virus]|nr:hypothetical protein [Sulfolobus spindle-shaped virus]